LFLFTPVIIARIVFFIHRLIHSRNHSIIHSPSRPHSAARHDDDAREDVRSPNVHRARIRRSLHHVIVALGVRQGEGKK